MLCPGMSLRGKWHGREYRVLQRLGSGANGEVYLVAAQGKLYALKISSHAVNIALEFRRWKELNREVQGASLGPFVVEMDDFQHSGLYKQEEVLFFYVMEYIKGVPLATFLSQRGSVWAGALILQLLSFLQHLHRRGFAYGDLKAENVLVEPRTGRLRLVDAGGITPFGQAVQQYTPWCDRAHWGMGARRADAAYDLFAVAQLLLSALVPGLERRFTCVADGPSSWFRLMRESDQRAECLPWRTVLMRAWQGRYAQASDMQADVARVQAMLMQRRNEAFQRGRRVESPPSAYARRAFFLRWDWSDWLLLSALLFACSVFVFFCRP